MSSASHPTGKLQCNNNTRKGPPESQSGGLFFGWPNSENLCIINLKLNVQSDLKKNLRRYS